MKIIAKEQITFFYPLSFKDPSGLAPEKERGGGNKLQEALTMETSYQEYWMELIRQLEMQQARYLERMLGYDAEKMNEFLSKIPVGGGGGRTGKTESKNGTEEKSNDMNSPSRNIFKDIWNGLKKLFSSDENNEEISVYKHIDNFQGVEQLDGQYSESCGFANIASIAKSMGLNVGIMELINTYNETYHEDWEGNGGAKSINLVNTAEHFGIRYSSKIRGSLTSDEITNSIDENEVILAGLQEVQGRHYITFTGYRIYEDGTKEFEYWDSKTGTFEFTNSLGFILPLNNDNIYGFKYLIP